MVIQEYGNNFLTKKYHSVTSFTQEHSNGCQRSERLSFNLLHQFKYQTL